jgi:hypothetical protein
VRRRAQRSAAVSPSIVDRLTSASPERLDVEASDIDYRDEPSGFMLDGRDVSAAGSTDQVVSAAVTKPIALKLRRRGDPDGYEPVLVGDRARAVPAAKTALARPHRRLGGRPGEIKLHLNGAAMAGTAEGVHGIRIRDLGRALGRRHA